MESLKEIVIIGYSGHAYVVCDILKKNNQPIKGYCEKNKKKHNPFNLNYLGNESDEKIVGLLNRSPCFIAIGNNKIRKNIYQKLLVGSSELINATHPTSVISEWATLEKGIMIGANAIINPLSSIGTGAVCNTGSIIEHECLVGDFAHVAPGAVLCGNVKVGNNSLIGAGSVVRPGVEIGENVIIGAGSIVVKNVPDHAVWVGNPARPVNENFKIPGNGKGYKDK